MKEIYDITIIGGGPVGLFATFYAGIRGVKTKIIDSLAQVGGQLTALYPEKYIYDIPGFAAIKACDFVHNLEKQIEPLDHTFCLEEQVSSVKKQDDLLIITTNKEVHYSRAVIIAIGNGAFQPRRLKLENAETFENKGLDYFVSDLERYKNKKVAIAGGGNSAIDWALMIEPIADEVSIIHRRTEFRGHEHSVNQLKNSRVKILTPYTIDSLLSNRNALAGLRLQKVKENKKIELRIDQLIVNYGFNSSLECLKEWGIEGNKKAIFVNSDMSTNIPGIYAIGDICTYQGKVKLLATGLGEAPTAVNNALHFISPAMNTQPAHSSKAG